MTTSTKAAHTPGPWTIDDGDSYAYGVFAEDLNAVCYLSEHPARGKALRGLETDRANAYLIAAAPEMLEAAENLLAWLREFYPDEPLFSPEPNHANATVIALEAAIQKARVL